MNRPFLISGATGQQGGAVARALLARGLAVRALTRGPSSAGASALRRAGATIVQGDFLDAPSLDRALASVAGAYSVQNYWKAGAAAELEQGRAFAQAARRARVPHFIYSSAEGAERGSGVEEFESKWALEQLIRQLDLPATILRPVFFMENWLAMKDSIAAGKIALPLSPQTRVQQVAVRDIGAFAALAFADPAHWIGQAVGLAGAELTMPESAAVFSRALGRPMKYVQVPWTEFAAQAGPQLTAVFRWLEREGHRADLAGLRQLKRDWTTLAAFVALNRGAFGD